MEHLGGDPRRHAAIGVGFGLERLVVWRDGIDDIRMIDAGRLAWRLAGKTLMRRNLDENETQSYPCDSLAPDEYG